MNKNLIGGIVIGILAVFALAWFLTDDAEAPTTTPYIAQDTNTADIFRANYMRECNIEGDLYNYCTCSYNYLVSNYSIGELVMLERDMDSSETIRVIDEALYACINEL